MFSSRNQTRTETGRVDRVILSLRNDAGGETIVKYVAELVEVGMRMIE